MINDPRVARILGDWQRARDTGTAPPPAQIIAEHPGLAEELRAGFAMATALDRVYAPDRGGLQSFPPRIGPYHLVREIGRGGMGTVYEATVQRRVPGLEVGDRVALKVAHPHLLAQAGFFKRFLREAEAGRRVRHPMVVSTFEADARDIDGCTHLYLAMEYVEGRTLRELLGELGIVPEALVREIATQIAAGLSGIHDNGIVHRDLKPDNVIITSDNQIRIMDMGVARVNDDHGHLTEHGQFAGSLHYAAPEQFDTREVGPPTDLYSLGVLLYELATGDNPFRRDEAGATIRAHLDEVPQRLDERDPELSRFISEVIAVLLAKDPVQRFDSAGDLQAVLEAGETSPWWSDREQALLKSWPSVPTVPVRRETTLYGRETELSLLAAAMESAQVGEGRFILLEGEAGIGKSRLVDAFLRGLEGVEPHVLYGSYPPGGGEGAITSALREHLGIAGLADALRPYLTVSPALVEPLAALLRQEPPPVGSPSLGGDALHAVLCRVMWALAAEKPLIWVVEDLHFASEDSRKIVLSLARALEGHRVLLLSTTRPGLAGDLYTNFSRVPGYQRASLARLSAREVILLLEDAFHSRMLAEKLGGRVALASDGVPFFVFEMIRGLRDGQFVTQLPDGSWVETKEVERIEVPQAVRELVEARLSRLSDDQRALLDVGAVFGHTFDADLIARVLGRNRLLVLQQLAGIERRFGVVRADGAGYRFDHHQIQEVVYGDMHESLRQEYHTLLAEALAEHEGGASEIPGSIVYLIARHHVEGVRPEEALASLYTVLTWLCGEGRNDDAVELGERALAVEGVLAGMKRGRTLLLLADRPLMVLGRTTASEAFVEEATRIAEETGDQLTLCCLAMTAGVLLSTRGHSKEALQRYEHGRDLARTLGDAPKEAQFLLQIGGLLLQGGEYSGARQSIESALPVARDSGEFELTYQALSAMQMLSMTAGDNKAALTYAEEGLALARAKGGRMQEADALRRIGYHRKAEGRLKEAHESFSEALTVGRESGHRGVEAQCLADLGMVETFQFQDDAAMVHFDRAARIHGQIGDRRGEAHVAVNLAQLPLRQGYLVRAKDVLEKALGIWRDLGARLNLAPVLVNLAQVWRFLGDVPRARECAEEAIVTCQECNDPYPEPYGRGVLSHLAWDAGDYDEAVHHAEASIRLSGESDPLGSVHTIVMLGELRWRTGDMTGAKAAAAEGVRLAKEHGHAVLEARALALRACIVDGADIQPAIEVLERVNEAASLDIGPTHLLLWHASGNSKHLLAAKDRLDLLLSRVPSEYHEGMCANVRENRETLVAWRAEFGEATASGNQVDEPS